MEKENETPEQYVRRIVTPVFDKVLQETGGNRRMVGSGGVGYKRVVFWQPHNYRLYFDFDRSKFIPPNRTVLELDQGTVSYGCYNYGSEHEFRLVKDCIVRIRKNTAEVTNLMFAKQWLAIHYERNGDIQKEVERNVRLLDERAKEALKLVIAACGGSSGFVVVRRRGEFGIRGDDFADRIPHPTVFDSSNFKKVYDEKVEGKNPIAVANYLENRALERFAPELTNSLKEILRRLPMHAKNEEAEAYLKVAIRVTTMFMQYVRVKEGRSE